MVPWRISQGETLYRDIHFHHGPLGPWLGALCDRVSGRSLAGRTLLAALICLAHLAALDRVSRRILSPWRAALATSVAVAVALFLRPGGWLFPFSFDTAIAVAALTWALVQADRVDRRRDGIAGLCLLLALVARIEMGLAGIVVLTVARRREPVRLLRLGFFPAVAAAVVYGAASLGTPLARLVADGWLRVVDPPAAFRSVYRAYAGLDRPGLRLLELALATTVCALIASLLLATAAIAGRVAITRRRAAEVIPVAGIAVLAAAAVLRTWPPTGLAEALSLVPPLVRVVPPCVLLAALQRLVLRARSKDPRGALSGIPDATLWLAAVFAARLFLAAGYVGPYDAFFLPLPVLVCVAGIFGIADRAAPAVGAALPRMAAAALCVFLASRCATVARFYRQPGWSEIETPAGSVWLPAGVAEATRDALADLSARWPSGSLLAGFPECGFFGYVLGFQNPFWLEQFFPGHLDSDGEDRAIALLRSRPPDALLYANVLAVGEGQRAFGTDYLRRLDEAARAGFPTTSIHGPGARPGARIGDPGFFVEIRRRPGAVR